MFTSPAMVDAKFGPAMAALNPRQRSFVEREERDGRIRPLRPHLALSVPCPQEAILIAL